MLTAIHRGTSIQKLSNELAKSMETGYNNAERLIRTELNYVQTRAAADSIVSAEMGYYQFIAVMDNRTTPICQSLDGEIFPIIELSQGENAPPMHVRCRSTIAASEDDGKQGRKPVGQRVARDEEGKRIKIPADMTYRDWKAVYIDKTRTLEDWRKAKDAEYAAAKEKAKRNPDPELVKGKQILDKLGRGEKLTPAPTLAERLVQNPNISASLRQSAERVIAASKDVPVLKCKNFSELQIYWADNYNVKVADSIKQLHFESVRLAMGGVEKVLLAFPPAIRWLNAFMLLKNGLMCTERQKGIINFNPEYFTDEREITSRIAAGVRNRIYPANMTVEGAGAHEAGHILEDWLIEKYEGTIEDVHTRIFAQNLVQRAYIEVMRTFNTAKDVKPLDQLREEISRYALKNMSECLATSVSDYVTNTDSASDLSKAIWIKLKEELS